MIVRVLPIHSTEAERTASEIRRLKTACCSTLFEDHKSDVRNFNLLCANFRNITVSCMLVSLCGKMQTGKAPNADTFHTVSPMESCYN